MSFILRFTAFSRLGLLRVLGAFFVYVAVMSGAGFGYAVGTESRSSDIEVPFDFYRNSVIVQAKINGKGPYDLLLDTGANPSAVDLSLARSIGLELASEGAKPTGGGAESNLSYETELQTLELGGLDAKKVAALAVDLSKTSQALGRPIQGVLGYSLLKGRIVQFDYPKRVVRFCLRSPFDRSARSEKNGPSLTTLSFHCEGEILLDGVKVNGAQVLANLDTGSNNSFQLTPDAVDKLALEALASQASVSKSVGINGVTVNRKGTVASISVGSIKVENPPVVFYGKGTGHDEEAWGLRIGNEFLKDFVVTVDYQNGLLTLEKP